MWLILAVYRADRLLCSDSNICPRTANYTGRTGLDTIYDKIDAMSHAIKKLRPATARAVVLRTWLLYSLLPAGSILGYALLLRFYGSTINLWTSRKDLPGEIRMVMQDRIAAEVWALSHCLLLIAWLVLNCIIARILFHRLPARFAGVAMGLALLSYGAVAGWQYVYTRHRPNIPPLQASPIEIDDYLFNHYQNYHYYRLPYIQNIGGGIAIPTVFLAAVAIGCVLAPRNPGEDHVSDERSLGQLAESLKHHRWLLFASAAFTVFSVLEIGSTYRWAIVASPVNVVPHFEKVALGSGLVIGCAVSLLLLFAFLPGELVLMKRAEKLAEDAKIAAVDRDGWYEKNGLDSNLIRLWRVSSILGPIVAGGAGLAVLKFLFS